MFCDPKTLQTMEVKIETNHSDIDPIVIRHIS